MFGENGLKGSVWKVKAIYLTLISFCLGQLATVRGSAFSECYFVFLPGLGIELSPAEWVESA